jgi:hypothetical protein
VVAVAGAKGRPAGALHCTGIGGQHAEAEAVAEAGADFPALDLYAYIPEYAYIGRVLQG